MGMISIQTAGSFGDSDKVISAQDHGHAHAVAEAIQYLSGEMLPKAIAQDHALQAKGVDPAKGWRAPE